MDYRRRYLRRLANQSQLNQDEEKTVPEKKGENRNMQNVYLQKLLEKSNSPSGSTINSYSVKDIFSTEDNRQKQIKYVMKREDRYGQRSPLNTNNNGWVSTWLIWNEKSTDPDDATGGAYLYALF